MRTPHPARLSPLGVLSCKHPDPDPDPDPDPEMKLIVFLYILISKI